METPLITLLLIQVGLIVLNGIFASAEIAILSTNKRKLERMAEEGNQRAQRLVTLTEEPARFLATIQVAITLSGFLGSAFAADNFAGPIVDWLLDIGVGIPESTLNMLAVIVITIILSYFTLIFGELVPKRLALKQSEALAMRLSGLVSIISSLFKPIVSFLSLSTNFVLRLIGIDPEDIDEQISEEEIRILIDEGSELGTIESQERTFIENVFEFNDIAVGRIVTHRKDVDILWLEDDIAEWERTIHDTRHTLYPVCDETADNVIGILNAKDYFRIDDKTKENVMNQAVTLPYFVIEATKANVLFTNMKAAKQNMAVVLDEYGGMVGVITLFDLFEEIMGDMNTSDNIISDGESYIKQMNQNTWVVQGNMPLDDISEAIGTEIHIEDVDTLTGLIFQRFGMVPSNGNAMLEFDIDNIHITVDAFEDHQVQHAKIQVMEE